MKRFLNNKSGLVFLVIFGLLGIFTAPAYAQMDKHTVDFLLKGNPYRVTVELTAEGAGTNVFLTGPDTPGTNLSISLPGENLFPVVTVHEETGRFFISWMQYKKNDVRLCYYDSFSGASHRIDMENFKSASPVQVIFRDNLPYLLIFRGNNSDNVDVFYYCIDTGAIRNITQTPDSELEVAVDDENSRFYIETKTIYHRYRFRIKKESLHLKQTKKVEVVYESERPLLPVADEILPQNTVAGFGDSITYGTMYLDPENLDDWYHPDLVYLAQLEGILAQDYGMIATENLGFPGDTSSVAIQRMDADFSAINAYFCLVMLGTNDVISHIFDVNMSVQNLEYIVHRARTVYGMYPIISTIPPMRRFGDLLYRRDNILALNAEIKAMARSNGVPYIDPYPVFVNYSGPGGWVDLMESWKGIHPNPDGHRIIADLFKEEILRLPPVKPREIALDTDSGTESSQTVEWRANTEFDISHYVIQFGYSQDLIYREVTTSDPFYTFVRNPLHQPFHSTVYYKIKAVDKDGNSSNYTRVRSFQFED